MNPNYILCLVIPIVFALVFARQTCAKVNTIKFGSRTVVNRNSDSIRNRQAIAQGDNLILSGHMSNIMGGGAKGGCQNFRRG